MVPFPVFMESALYDPQAGFYPRRAHTADFYTAPELHPAFGAAVARALAARLRALEDDGAGPLTLVEMGAGCGVLARQVMDELSRREPDLRDKVSFVLVERCAPDLEKALELCAPAWPRVRGAARLAEVPAFAGVLYSNELVDALPVHVLERRAGVLGELYVGEGGATEVGPLSRPELGRHAAAVSPSLPEGGRHAVSLEAERWLELAAAKLEAGFLLTIDYGKRFAEGEVNAPRSFKAHSVSDELVDAPGTRDLTASVDFERLVARGRELGLETDSYHALNRFLVDNGLLESLPAGDDLASIKSRSKIKTLLLPEGMGEVFKVLVQRKVTRS